MNPLKLRDQRGYSETSKYSLGQYFLKNINLYCKHRRKTLNV